MIRVGIIGFGGIAKGAHKSAYDQLAAEGLVKLAAICDLNIAKAFEAVETNLGAAKPIETDAKLYDDYHRMLAQEQLDMVDVCLPTYLHAPVAIDCLNSGRHVLVEKPMALSAADAQRMTDAARKAGKQLMVGHCLRFSPVYNALRACILDQRYGPVHSAFFERLSHPPIWGWENWFMDVQRSGGCLFDMHVHDVDMARYLFGEPQQVSCETRHVYSSYDANVTRLSYANGPLVCAVGDWSLTPSHGFQYGFRVAFAEATMALVNQKLRICPKVGEMEELDLSGAAMYREEIRHLLGLIAAGAENTIVPPEDSVRSIRLIERLKESADAGGETLTLAT